MKNLAQAQPAIQRRAAIYVRVSTQGQEEDGTSLQTQEARCREYASQDGYVVDETQVYREVYSGASLYERPHLTKLREAARRRAFAVLIAYAVDRLSRDQAHLYIVAEEMERQGVLLEFVTERFEDSAVGKFIRSAKAFAAEVEREKITERTVRGKRARVESGKLLPGCRPLYGYRFSPDRTAYEIDPLTGPVVAAIFESAARGTPLRAIAADLTDRAIATPSNRGLPFWHYSTLYQVLINPNYTGQAVAWRPKGAHLDPTSTKLRPTGAPIHLPDGVIPPLVDAATFGAVQQRLQLNKLRATRRSRDPEATLLRGGYVRCGYCQRTMLAVPRDRDARSWMYRCGHSTHGRGACSRHAMSATELDAIAWRRVHRILTTPDIIEEEIGRLERDDPTTADLTSVDAALHGVERQQRNLVDQLANLGGSVAAMVTEKLTELDVSRTRLLSERGVVLGRRATWEAARSRLHDLEAWRLTVAANADELTYEQRRLALDALGVTVYVWRADHEPRYDVQSAICPDTAIVFSTP